MRPSLAEKKTTIISLPIARNDHYKYSICLANLDVALW